MKKEALTCSTSTRLCERLFERSVYAFDYSVSKLSRTHSPFIQLVRGNRGGEGEVRAPETLLDYNLKVLLNHNQSHIRLPI